MSMNASKDDEGGSPFVHLNAHTLENGDAEEEKALYIPHGECLSYSIKASASHNSNRFDPKDAV